MWSGAELAARLGVTERTLRRDIVRLRDLGYRIDSVQGVGGGYRLASGRVLPPLVLDEEEAIAVAACLEGSDGGTLLGQAARRASFATAVACSLLAWVGDDSVHS